MVSFSESLPVRPAYRNLRSLRALRNSGARKTTSVEEDQVRDH